MTQYRGSWPKIFDKQQGCQTFLERKRKSLWTNILNQYQIGEPYLTGCLGAAVMDILDCQEVEAGIATGAGVPPAGAPVSTFVLPSNSLPNITIILFCAVYNY